MWRPSCLLASSPARQPLPRGRRDSAVLLRIVRRGGRMQHRVIVVGAAVAGSAVANAFGQAGIPTLVLEKGAERDNSTRGDILHPPTLAFLERWGVLGPLHEDG